MAIRARLLALDVNFGDALMLVAVIAYAGYTVALRFKPDIHWQSLMIATDRRRLRHLATLRPGRTRAGAGILPDARGWGVILYTAIFPSILAQIFYMRGVELIGANRAGLFINLVPIFGTLLSIAPARRGVPRLPRRAWRWCSAAYGWRKPADARRRPIAGR